MGSPLHGTHLGYTWLAPKDSLPRELHVPSRGGQRFSISLPCSCLVTLSEEEATVDVPQYNAVMK